MRTSANNLKKMNDYLDMLDNHANESFNRFMFDQNENNRIEYLIRFDSILNKLLGIEFYFNHLPKFVQKLNISKVNQKINCIRMLLVNANYINQ